MIEGNMTPGTAGLLLILVGAAGLTLLLALLSAFWRTVQVVLILSFLWFGAGKVVPEQRAAVELRVQNLVASWTAAMRKWMDEVGTSIPGAQGSPEQPRSR